MGFVNDAFPIEIADILINAFSEEGDTVADIFGGTGTTAISSMKNNRKAIYNDASIEQFNLAKKRVYDIIETNTDNERQDNMTKEDALNIMLESINSDNLALGLQQGLSEEDMRHQIEQSQQSLNFMMSNIYDKLKDAGCIA
jgi:adenine-specific DNA methylase